MPNAIGPTGLTTATLSELVTQFTTAFQTIYGADIDLDPDSPDGQMMMIFIQAVLDLEDLLTQVYNMFDPDNAVGVVLDQRVAINGIQRQAGTFTITNITIATNQSVNLYGLDQTIQPVFTVADAAGNQYQLQVTQLGFNPGSGGTSLAFQAVTPGAVLTVPNTITIPVTIVLGVTTINNPTASTTTGINEESDAVLRVRRQQSVSLASQGYLKGLLAALENITGVESAFVYENVTGTTNGDGVPGHSIWVIVAGTAAPVDIATAIYLKRNAGCGMFGATTYNVIQTDGSSFTIAWDTVVAENLFIKFTATSLDGINAPNIIAIRAGLPISFVPGVNEEVNINHLATLVQAIDPNTLVTNAGFSSTSGGSYTNTLSPTTKNKQFAVSSPNIIILPMILSPTSAVVVHGTTKQFTALGGFGAPTYAFTTNNSGGTINSSTGLYTAGSTPSVTDTIHVTDALSNTATATISVT
jgi:hypothetical protein